MEIKGSKKQAVIFSSGRVLWARTDGATSGRQLPLSLLHHALLCLATLRDDVLELEPDAPPPPPPAPPPPLLRLLLEWILPHSAAPVSAVSVSLHSSFDISYLVVMISWRRPAKRIVSLIGLGWINASVQMTNVTTCCSETSLKKRRRHSNSEELLNQIDWIWFVRGN